MFENLPFGQTPIGKSRHVFDDTPALSKKCWAQLSGKYLDDGIAISYVGNSGGYRTKEWNSINWNNCVLFLGDSATYGHGSAEINTIPKIIEKETGLECVNLSIPGAASELLINISCVIINEVTPKIVVLGHPSMPRIWDPISATGNLGPWLQYAKGFAKESHELYNCWTSVNQRLIHKCTTNSYTLRTLWRHTNLIEWAWNKEVSSLLEVPYYKYFGHTVNNLSRDGYHANKNIHSTIAREIIKCF
jgi:hypothetical protein